MVENKVECLLYWYCFILPVAVLNIPAAIELIDRSLSVAAKISNVDLWA
jgi:hypothetical protein